ncbi:MAG: calcineurin-like phosphoesterase family protein [Odoribacteraceae bacterium]|jgi:hypothetical protein|nr:calcineurin-like phosphoesterase family protein [Odoribacteraceae bacterium]
MKTNIYLLACILLASVAACRSGDDIEPEPLPPPEPSFCSTIKEVVIPTALAAVLDTDLTFEGKGFAVGDSIKMMNVVATGGRRDFAARVTAVTAGAFTFTVPANMTSGKYAINISRGDLECSLGVCTLTLGANVPPRAGMTLRGMVANDGAGIAGVVVSDGYEVTTTDNNGRYYISSAKKNGFVFISVPGNYEVANEAYFPLFFQRVNSADPSAEEQHDFALTPVDNRRHAVVVMADFHLANRGFTRELEQFDAWLPDINATIAAQEAAGKRVYGLTLGDLVYDAYWYASDPPFLFPDFMARMNKVRCTTFHTMGNHDYSPDEGSDWQREQPWRETMGPTYYSFNLGNVHYVVLDNMVARQTSGYETRVSDEQLAWLRKDLATVTDKSAPLVVAMHVPLYQIPSVTGTAGYGLTGGATLRACWSAFTNVQVLTGHSHSNFTHRPATGMEEHNIGAICATWWWTGRNADADNHICGDGSVGGYAVFDFDGARLAEWYYKSFGYSRDYQFRAYDLNAVHITPARYAPNATAAEQAELIAFAGPYATANTRNEVLINVFAYGAGWSLEVTEGGVPLAVTRVKALDPLHIISYEAPMLNRHNTANMPTLADNTHMFRVQASSATSTLVIKAADGFGHVYTETMTRPKAFNCATR